MAYNVKFLKGTASSYAGLAEKDINTFYYIDGQDLYLGNVKLSNGADLTAAIADIAANSAEISKIKTALGTLTKTDFDALVARMNTAESDIDTLQSDVNTLKETTGNHTTKLGTLEGTVSGHTTSIQELTNTVSDLSENSATKTELASVAADVEANKSAIATLNGEGPGSVSSKVAEGIAKVVAGAPEDFDTLKEVADWIASDTTGAAKMQTDISNLKTATEGLDGRLDTAETDITTLETKMEAVEQKASDNAANISTNTNDIAANTEAIATNAGNISKNAKAISDEVTRAQNAEKGLSDRVAELENKTSGEGTIAQQIATAKEAAISASNTYTDGQITASATTLRGEIKAAKEAAIETAGTNADAKYATKAQGALADSALQPDDIASGTTNGTIKVNGSDIAVTGLKSAAYQEASAFDPANSAASAQAAAIKSAKEYADSLAKNYDKAGAASTVKSEVIEYVDTALTWGSM